ncbi:hypothetical protein [Roseivivax isoporae]|uniref:Uncharacterized protein n=1 Tax=Roseivivax isoporae LMG 25204 TaxID=1449351 RepID=X7F4R8_9RHOB|nr:hypothetical protein [Roseivivax isoporae]ETX27029.1 hypothetical protein RISW2_16915 [Roseivivax isoporae LMG 25204]
MTPSSTKARTAAGHSLFQPKKKEKAEERSSDLPVAIQLGEHGRYQIKSGLLSGEYVARAFPKPPSNARGLIAEAKGATEEAAIAALHQVLETREVRRTEDRRVDEATGSTILSPEEYVEALSQVALSRPQRALLTALAFADAGGLTEASLARAAGYKSRASANRAFASAGLLIGTYLSVETSAMNLPSEPDGATLLGYRGTQRNDDDPGNWILHAEVRDAVRSVL